MEEANVGMKNGPDYRKELDEIKEALGPFYHVIRTAKSWEKVVNGWEYGGDNEELVKNLVKTAKQVNEHVEIDAEEVVESVYKSLLPRKLQPIAGAATKLIMQMSWDKSVDMLSETMKEYGKDEEGLYENTKKVLGHLIDGAVRDTLEYGFLRALFEP